MADPRAEQRHPYRLAVARAHAELCGRTTSSTRALSLSPLHPSVAAARKRRRPTDEAQGCKEDHLDERRIAAHTRVICIGEATPPSAIVSMPEDGNCLFHSIGRGRHSAPQEVRDAAGDTCETLTHRRKKRSEASSGPRAAHEASPPHARGRAGEGGVCVFGCLLEAMPRFVANEP